MTRLTLASFSGESQDTSAEAALCPVRRQVPPSHYEFSRYMSEPRWCSLWHQLDQVQKLQPETVLEVGPGLGTFKTMAATLGLRVETLDLDPELRPDHVASALDMPFPEASYDVVCAFQMLEHLPYEESLKAFAEMTRVSRRHVVISLPDAQPVTRLVLEVPGRRQLAWLIPPLFWKAPQHVFDGQHHWEINKQEYPLARVVRDFSQELRLVRTFRVPGNPYHRFFLFSQEQRLAASTPSAS